MNLIYRDNCPITGENDLELLHSFKNFPIYMGATLSLGRLETRLCVLDSSTTKEYIFCQANLICESSSQLLKIASAESWQMRSAYNIPNEIFETTDVCFKITGRKEMCVQPWLSRSVLRLPNRFTMQRHGVWLFFSDASNIFLKHASTLEASALTHELTPTKHKHSDFNEFVAHSEAEWGVASTAADENIDQRNSLSDDALI